MSRSAFSRMCLALVVLIATGVVTCAHAGEDAILAGDAAGSEPGRHQSVLRLTDADAGRKIALNIGIGKSTLIELPRPARDVMVSNPQVVDAVVQSSNRIFLLARRFGESNAFVFDENGEQFATIEVFVERETSGLEALLRRLIPGSNIKVEMLNGTAVLTGTVRTPVDSNRATALASQFVKVEFEAKSADAQGVTMKQGDQYAGR